MPTASPRHEASRRELAAVALFACLALVPFMGKAYHNDEPFFLAAAAHAAASPLRPLDFKFTWFGSPVEASRINTTPPLPLYMMALAHAATGGAERPMRLMFLPVDLLAAMALYLLARRFLSGPLPPTLIVIASPAYLVNMNHLMPEKPALAFGLCALYALVRGVDDDEPRWFWGSALLMGAALMSKYAAVILLLPAAGYALHRGVSAARIAAFGALALSPAALLAAWYALFNPALVDRAWSVTADSAVSWWSSGPHKLRSLLAFTGGCGVVTVFWPFILLRRASRWVLGAGLAAVLILFFPYFDLAPVVRKIDRLTGILFSCGALLGFYGLFCAEARRMKGWALWAPWILSAVLIQGLFYWSVMARTILWLIPPLIFGMAELLETRWPYRRLKILYGSSLVLVAALSLSLAWVDYRYAAAQKEFSSRVARDYLAQGRKVWFTGYMGLQYYLENAGARGLDAARGGWDLTQPGDAVVVLGINSAPLKPSRPLKADVHSWTADCSIPLRLISGWTGEGGFYSNVWGFLPFSLSREPLEEFKIVELL